MFKEEKKLINESPFIDEKLKCYSAFLNISNVTRDILRNDYPQGIEYFQNMLNAYLKVYIESLREKVSVETFYRGFLRGVKVNPLAQNESIKEVLTYYEENLSLLYTLMPYIDEIDKLNANIYAKERFLDVFRNFLSTTFKNCYEVFKSEDIPKIHILITNILSKKVVDFIKKSNNLREFIHYLRCNTAEVVIQEINSSNLSLIYTVDDTFQQKILETFIAYILSEDNMVEPSDDVGFKSFIGEKLQLNREDVIKNLLDISNKLKKKYGNNKQI